MTQIMRKEKQCSVCGSIHKYNVLLSTNTFGGSSDLDLRPPEMKRSTMHVWVHECPSCGYVAADISDTSNVSLAYLRSEGYCTCDHINFESDLASQFYKLYKIKVLDNNVSSAFYAVLHAAWASDDKEDIENAIKCREIAITLIDQLIELDPENNDDFKLLKADLLRRAKKFEKLIGEYANIHFKKELLNEILAFQLKLAQKGDTACYRISDATQKLSV